MAGVREHVEFERVMEHQTQFRTMARIFNAIRQRKLMLPHMPSLQDSMDGRC
jgi:hypothetical protein